MKFKLIYVRGGEDYEQIKVIKERVNEIQTDLCEGVKLRAKLRDRVEGERIF